MKKTNLILAAAAVAVALPAISEVGGIPEKSEGRSRAAVLAGEKAMFSMDEAPAVNSIDAAVRAAQTVKAPANKPAKAAGEPIYFEPFATEADFNKYTVIDGNNDGHQWEYVAFYAAPRVSTYDIKLDDWMISPGIELEAGKSYKFTIDVRPGSGNKQEDLFEVLAGREAKPEAMNIEIIPVTPTQFIGYEGYAPYYTTYTGWLTTEETGTYHIGMHAVSEPGAYTFYARNLTLYPGVQAAGPESVTDLTAVPDPDGELSVDISFKAPTEDSQGQDLISLSKIELFRGETLVHTFENPAIGASMSYTDTPDSIGDYTYTAKPFNSAGEGKSAEVEVFVGVGMAAAPEAVDAAETETEGEVTVSWTPVTTGAEGGYINASKVKYWLGCIMPDGTVDVIADFIEDTTYTYQAVEADDQKLLQYVVAAVTDRGYSETTLSEPLCVGTPAAVPWTESFPNATLNTVMGTKALTGQCQWSISRDESFQNMHSADDDNGYVSFWTTAPGDQGRLYTGKFLLKDLKNPAVSFYIYKRTSGTPDIGTIEVELNDGNGFTTIQTVTAEPYPVKGWNKVVVPIPAEYMGKVVQLGFKATRVTYTYQFLDQLKIEDLMDHNLMVTSVTGPAEIEPGKEFRIEGVVTNTGALDAEGYKLVLKSNGNKVAEKFGQTISTGSQAKVSFKVTETVAAGKNPVYTLAVEWDQDQNADDNEADLTVFQRINDYPVPTALEAEGTDDSIVISWTAPEFNSDEVPGDVLEDFEEYPSFANSGIGDWILYDGDKGKIGGFHLPDGQEIVMPGIPMNSQQSWWVMDHAAESLSDLPNYAAKSGTKYLAQQYVTGGVVCDDWVISPEIYSGGQTISFFARSFQASEPESFEVLYSTGSTEPADFVKICSIDDTPAAWTEYNVQIPEGARRFAIRCTSNYKAMMFIDDISYIPVGTNGLELKGYNVYRDNKLVTAEPITETTYSETGLKLNETHSYQVSAVYAQGESQAAGPVRAVANGIETVSESAAGVSVLPGRILIDNAGGENVTVCTASGTVIFRTSEQGLHGVTAVPGIYAVSIGAKSVKVVVR